MVEYLGDFQISVDVEPFVRSSDDPITKALEYFLYIGSLASLFQTLAQKDKLMRITGVVFPVGIGEARKRRCLQEPARDKRLQLSRSLKHPSLNSTLGAEIASPGAPCLSGPDRRKASTPNLN